MSVVSAGRQAGLAGPPSSPVRVAPSAPRTRLRGQLVRFAGIGAASTVVHLGLLALLQQSLGAQLANLTALVVATVGNTAANRAWTFGVRGTHRLAHHHLQSLSVFALTWGSSGGALALLAHLWPGAATWLSVTVVAAANLVSTAARFVAMRSWIFRTSR